MRPFPLCTIWYVVGFHGHTCIDSSIDFVRIGFACLYVAYLCQCHKINIFWHFQNLRYFTSLWGIDIINSAHLYISNLTILFDFNFTSGHKLKLNPNSLRATVPGNVNKYWILFSSVCKLSKTPRWGCWILWV